MGRRRGKKRTCFRIGRPKGPLPTTHPPPPLRIRMVPPRTAPTGHTMQTQPENQPRQQETTALLRGNRDLAVLYSIAGYLNHKVDVHEALQEVLARVTELLGLQTGWVWLLDESGEPRLAASLALPPYLADHPDRMTGYCLCLDTFL